MEVVRLQQSHLLAGSTGAKSLINSEGFSWDSDGLDEGDDDV